MIQRKKTNIVAVLFRSKLEFKKRYSSFFVIFPVLVLVSMLSSLENVSVWVGADWLVLLIKKNKKRTFFAHSDKSFFVFDQIYTLPSLLSKKEESEYSTFFYLQLFLHSCDLPTL